MVLLRAGFTEARTFPETGSHWFFPSVDSIQTSPSQQWNLPPLTVYSAASTRCAYTHRALAVCLTAGFFLWWYVYVCVYVRLTG